MPPQPRQINVYWLLIPLAALIVCAPEFLYGPSCGHDFDFHLQGWMDAAAQLRAFHYPHWSTTSAWHAGEPRFTFYPPLSWLLGATLTMLLPPDAVPVAFTFLALTGAGLSMYALAKALTGSQAAAILAACVYLANPYLLFNGYERTAFAELLAATFFPLLFLAAIRRRFSPSLAALPIAALWLTNAPAGIMGVYLFAFLMLGRLFSPHARGARLQLSLQASIAGALGLALPAFYLLPVFAERHLIQLSMAEIPSMSPAGNFLFGHTGDAPHDRVLHTASTTAVVLLLTAAAALPPAIWRQRHIAMSDRTSNGVFDRRSVLLVLTALLLTIALLLTPASRLLWRILPELALLQFPWRLLSILGCVAAASVALAVYPQTKLSNQSQRLILTAVGSLTFTATLTAICTPIYRQGCDVDDPPHRIAELLRTGHGYDPTDEYTPAAADNDVLRFDSPGSWLVPPEHPEAPAPNTLPNPAESNPDGDVQPPSDETVSAEAPHHVELHLTEPRTLVLNRRDWPAWQVVRNGAVDPHRVTRDDGLIALPLPAGDAVIDLRWHTPPEFYAGEAVSVVAVLFVGWLWLERRKTHVR